MTDRRNAIDTAHYKLHLGQTALEGSRPRKKDIEAASEAATDASKILKACLALLDHDCYEVMEAPPLAGPPLFDGAGQPRPEATVIDVESEPAAPGTPTLGCIKHPLDGLTMEEAVGEFGGKIEVAEGLWLERGLGTLKAWARNVRKAWFARFAYDPFQAWDDLTAAIEDPASDLLPPQEAEA